MVSVFFVAGAYLTEFPPFLSQHVDTSGVKLLWSPNLITPIQFIRYFALLRFFADLYHFDHFLVSDHGGHEQSSLFFSYSSIWPTTDWS